MDLVYSFCDFREDHLGTVAFDVKLTKVSGDESTYIITEYGIPW